MSGLIWQDMRNAVRSIRFWLAAAAVVISALINLALNSRLFMISGTLNVFFYATTFGFGIFTFTAPIIAVLPASRIFSEELDSGCIRQMLLRTGRSRYLTARILSSASAAALATVAGLGAVLLLCLALDPRSSYRTMPLLEGRAFKAVYDRSMLGYAGLFIANAAVFSAAYSLLALGLAAVVRNRYLTLALPAALYIASTLSSGLFLGLPILPFATFSLASVTAPALGKDHLTVALLGLGLFYRGFARWQETAG